MITDGSAAAHNTTVIPIEESILFQDRHRQRATPRSWSLLRAAYRSWYFKFRRDEFEAIGVERDLAGMPAQVPADYLNAAPTTPRGKTVEAFKKMVRGVRRDENEVWCCPEQWDPDTKQQLFDFELMSSGGTRQFDTNSIIQRYEQRILMSVLADFHPGPAATRTPAPTACTPARPASSGCAERHHQTIADTLNRYAVPRLFELNAWKLDELPKIVPNNVDHTRHWTSWPLSSAPLPARHAVVPGPGAGEVHPRDRPAARDDRRGRRLRSGSFTTSSGRRSSPAARWTCSACSRRPR